MKRDEKNVSKKFFMTLKCTYCEKLPSNCWTVKFKDKDNIEWVHYQIVPEACKSDAASRMARAYLSKLGVLGVAKGSPIGKYYSVQCCYRQMNDGRIWNDADTIYDRYYGKANF